MKKIRLTRDTDRNQRVPLWKWLVIILLILALPLYFSFYRDMQIQQALSQINQANLHN